MRFPNEVIWCLPDILAAAFLSVCPQKLTKADQSQPTSFPCFDPPLFVAYKREGSVGDITIDVHQGFFLKYAMMSKCKELNIYN